MFEAPEVTTSEDLTGLLATLSRLDADVSDAERVDQLTALERVKAACAAAQARITVDFAESQEQVAQAWRQRARECADADDFDGWRAARAQARRACAHGDAVDVQTETGTATPELAPAYRRHRHPDRTPLPLDGTAGRAR